MRIILLSFLLLIYSLTTLAKPLNCDPITIQNNDIVLDSARPRFVLFHSTANYPIFITHSASQASPEAWSSKIETDHWSVLFLPKQKMSLHCIESRPGHEQIVTCQHLLSLCQLPASPQPHHKAKWISENTDQPLLPPAEESVVH